MAAENNLVQLSVDKSALKTSMICSSILLIKCLASNLGIGKARIDSGGRPPEDEQLFKGKGPQSFDGSHGRNDTTKQKLAKELEKRKVRITANDLENIPISLLLNYISLLSGANPSWHIGLTVLFTISRIAHTISYEMKLQPHRALAYFGGIIGSVGFAINGCIGISNL